MDMEAPNQESILDRILELAITKLRELDNLDEVAITRIEQIIQSGNLQSREAILSALQTEGENE